MTMWNSIIKQLWNERKKNALIWIELIIIATFVWYTVDALYVSFRNMKRPLGFDISHTYHLVLAQVEENSGEYDKTAAEAAKPGEYFLTIIDRLRQNSQVEAVCYTNNSHFHYIGRNYFTIFKHDSVMRNGYVRYVSPSYFQVFQVKTANGGDPEELAKTLVRNEIVVTATVGNDFFGSANNAVNREINCANQGGDNIAYRIGNVCEPQRYSDFSNQYDYAYYQQISAEDTRNFMYVSYPGLNLFVRIKPGYDNKTFPETFRKEIREQINIGNIYLKDIIPMSEYREQFIRRSIDDIRMNIAVVGFFLMNVLLGVVGTFWLGTQQKRSEIGLRIAIGATRPAIFRMLATEGFVLLLAAFIPALLIFTNLLHAGVVQEVSWLPVISRFSAGMTGTFLLLGMMVCIGICYPAWHAMKENPTEALHNE